MYYIYILYSTKLIKKYIGSCENISKRLKQHQRGSVPFTSVTKDWKLIYYEAFLYKKDALGEERFLKTGKGRERLKFLLEHTMKEEQ